MTFFSAESITVKYNKDTVIHNISFEIVCVCMCACVCLYVFVCECVSWVQEGSTGVVPWWGHSRLPSDSECLYPDSPVFWNQPRLCD